MRILERAKSRIIRMLFPHVCDLLISGSDHSIAYSPGLEKEFGVNVFGGNGSIYLRSRIKKKRPQMNLLATKAFMALPKLPRA